MRQVTIKSITLEGFGSYVEPFTFNVNRKGINILRATNGRGKSTIFNAMVWSMYGISIKEVNKDKIVSYKHKRPKNFKGTRVMLDVSVDGADFTVARHIKYKGRTNEITGGDSLMVFQNGDLISAGKSIEAVQEQINDIIGLDGRLFVNSVMFAQRAKKFINTSNSEKRDVLEQVFDLEWISWAADFARKEVTRLDKEIAALRAEHSALQLPYNSRLAAYTANTTNLVDNKERINQSLLLNGNNVTLWRQQLTEKQQLLLTNNAEDINNKVLLCTASVKEDTDALKLKSTQLQELQQQEAVRKATLEGLEEQRKANVYTLNALTTNRTVKQTSLSLLQVGKQTQIDSLQGEIDVITGNISTCTTTIETIEKSMEECSHSKDIVEAELKKAKDKEAQIKLSISSLNSEIARISTDLDNLGCACTRCGHTPTEEEKEPTRILLQASLEQENKKLEATRLEKTIVDTDVYLWEVRSKVHESNEAKLKGIQDRSNEKLRLEAALATTQATLQQLTSGAQETQLQADISALALQITGAETISTQLANDIEANKATSKSATIESLSEDIRVAEGALQAKSMQLEECTKTQLVLASAVSEVTMLENAIKGSVAEAAKLQEELTTLTASEEKLVTEYNELMVMFNSMSTLSQRITDITEEQDRYKWWQSVGFGTSGIKSLVFSVMLSKLNEAMQVYSQQLGVSARFVVDLDKARRDIEVEVLQDGYVVGYGGLSGGEQQRVDIVSMFGMHDLVSSSDVSVNVLCLDEVTENLDVQGVEEVFNLIKFKQQTTPSVWVITHNPELSITNANIVDLSYEIANA